MSQAGTLSGFVHRRRRGAELVLLLLALAMSVGAYVSVGLGTQGSVPANTVTYSLWLAALMLGCHVVVRFFAPYADPVLLPVVAALNGLGLAILFRFDLASAADARKFATSQLTWTTLGVILFVGILVGLRDHRRLQAFTYTSGLGAIALLLLPLTPFGTEINGARIWVSLFGFSLQPGEIAKVLLVIAFAGYLVQHRDALALAGRRFLFIDLPRGRDLGPILAMWVICLLVLVFQKDLGTSLLFFGIFLVMLYVATERPGWLVVGASLVIGAAALAWLLLELGVQRLSYVQVRIDGWLDPFAADSNAGQLVQGLYGMGWGGLVGQGLGQGSPFLTPLAFSDFIFTAVGEELGLTGAMAVILLYGLIVERALRTALLCRDGFGKLIATGLGVVFAVQVFVVIGGVTRLIPLTGLTTPFMSAGGSALVANWMIIALILRISDHARRPPPEVSSGDDADQTQVVKLS